MSVALEPGVAELVDLLAEEERLYAELLRIGQQEQGAILGNEPTQLRALVAAKERTIERIARAETERQSWLAAWTTVRGLVADLTLAELARGLPATDASRLAAVRDALLRRVRDVAEMNNRNSQLLGGALRIVNRSIEVYSRVGGGNSYQPSGERSAGSRTIVLDRRV